MPDLILHHYELSPFSEKVRRILAFKGLEWRSVRAPAVMPKPDLVALTGGYRKIPVLQIGSDVYCDTALIARVLERIAPEPTLYPTPLAEGLAEWFDRTVFETVVPFVARPTRFDEALRLLTPEELSKMGEDRAAMRTDFGKKALGFRTARANLAVYLERLDRALDGRPFVLGDAPCIADFSAYHAVWLLEKIAPEPLAGYERLPGWMERIAQIAGPEASPLQPEEALRICRQTTAQAISDEGFVDPQGLARGEPVVVRAGDYGCDPVSGTLVLSLPNEIALRREDPRAGVVTVHFPRIGYEIVKGAPGGANP